MTIDRATLDRTTHDERISLLWRQAAVQIGCGMSAADTLAELAQEQDKCEEMGCYDVSP